jgi:maltose alpha-D-glucosyltransferase/alpha-amylase
VPAVTGALEYFRPAEDAATVGIMQQLVESQADGWEHATDWLSGFYDQVATRPVPNSVGPATFVELASTTPPRIVAETMSAYLETAATLGRRTAEMHVALAADASTPAFAPEPFGKAELAAVSANALAEAQRALHTLEVALERQAPDEVATPADAALRLSADVRERAQTLLTSREAVFEKIRSVASLDFTASKIRVHGDYHLGQVLWAEGDFYILDFEGEPTRTIAERRQKQSPFKDVAGMLRSFSYAAYASLFAHTSARPAELARMEGWARLWRTWVTGAFLRAYFDAAGSALFVPTNPSQREALLRFFILSKALYELNYELNNRPDWVRIPLWGILELI